MPLWTTTTTSSLSLSSLTLLVFALATPTPTWWKDHELWFYYSRRYPSNAFTFCILLRFVMTKTAQIKEGRLRQAQKHSLFFLFILQLLMQSKEMRKWASDTHTHTQGERKNSKMAKEIYSLCNLLTACASLMNFNRQSKHTHTLSAVCHRFWCAWRTQFLFRHILWAMPEIIHS